MIASVLLLISLVQPYFLILASRIREKVIIMDSSGTFHVSPVFGVEEAKSLHIYIASLAANSLLNRSNTGLDNQELFDQVFIKPAHNYGKELIASQQREFDDRKLHQKAEIGEISILETGNDRVMAQVSGQLVRSGTFKNRPFTEGKNFQLDLIMVRNPRLGQNGRLPYAVWKLEYKEKTDD